VVDAVRGTKEKARDARAAIVRYIAIFRFIVVLCVDFVELVCVVSWCKMCLVRQVHEVVHHGCWLLWFLVVLACLGVIFVRQNWREIRGAKNGRPSGQYVPYGTI
jgi:hypothetical protein